MLENKINPGKNQKGQKKRGKKRSGPASESFIEDASMRHNSTYKKKTTLLKKAKNFHETTKSEILLIIKTSSGKRSVYASAYYEKDLRHLMSSFNKNNASISATATSPSTAPLSSTATPSSTAPPSSTATPSSTALPPSSTTTTSTASPLSVSVQPLSHPSFHLPTSSSSTSPLTSSFPSPQPIRTNIVVRAEVHEIPNREQTPSPQLSLSSPSPSFPSPQPTFLPPNTCTNSESREKRSSANQTAKKRRVDKAVYKSKCTQTESITSKVPDTCNVCLTTQTRGHWVGCDRARCGYWVHDQCMGFYFSSNAILKKTNFKCPIHR